MKELAQTHLKQAISFLNSGDAARAIDLLERGLLLARGDASLERKMLHTLAEAYAQTGHPEQAARCRARLGEPPIDLYDLPRSSPSSRFTRTRWILLGTHAAVALLASAVTYQITLARVARPLAAATRPAVAWAAPTTAPATMGANVTLASATQPGLSERQQALGETVGRLVVLARYVGPANGQERTVDVPLASGAAFAATAEGVLATSRSLLEAGDDSLLPSTLASAGLPLLTLRERIYLVEFPAAPNQRWRARLAYRSERFDLALLRIDRAFAKPLVFATRPPSQGESLQLCGSSTNVVCPTSAQAMEKRVKESANTPDPVAAVCPTSPSTDLLDMRILAAERNIDAIGYLQLELPHGEMTAGMPVLNDRDEVLAIAAPAVTHGEAGQHYATLVAQLKDELTANAPRR